MAKRTDVTTLRRRIEEARGELARAEGEQGALDGQITETVRELREALGCAPGKEKEAMTLLRKKITEDEADIERMLYEVESLARDSR